MDEPFGALDSSRAIVSIDLVRLWWERKLTTVFVTHSIPSGVSLPFVVVMGARPGRVFKTMPIDEPHPRRELRNSPHFANTAAVGVADRSIAGTSAALTESHAPVQSKPPVRRRAVDRRRRDGGDLGDRLPCGVPIFLFRRATSRSAERLVDAARSVGVTLRIALQASGVHSARHAIAFLFVQSRDRNELLSYAVLLR